jgi:hypothetical protein
MPVLPSMIIVGRSKQGRASVLHKSGTASVSTDLTDLTDLVGLHMTQNVRLGNKHQHSSAHSNISGKGIIM